MPATSQDDVRKAKGAYQVPAVMRALDIIEYIAQRQEASFTEIFTDLGLPKSTTYQILGTLADRGYVRHSGGSTKFSLGLRLFELGSQAVTRLDIRTEGTPVLQELVDDINETAHLGILDGIEGVYLAKVEGTSPVRLYSWEGKRLHLHCTAMGKVLLAFQEPAAQADLLDRITLVKSTEHTITDRDKLVEHLKMVRERGWALDDQENEAHIRCLAAPVHAIGGGVAAAISISGLASQFDGEYLLELSEKVRAACNKLSFKLGA